MLPPPSSSSSSSSYSLLSLLVASPPLLPTAVGSSFGAEAEGGCWVPEAKASSSADDEACDDDGDSVSSFRSGEAGAVCGAALGAEEGVPSSASVDVRCCCSDVGGEKGIGRVEEVSSFFFFEAPFPFFVFFAAGALAPPPPPPPPPRAAPIGSFLGTSGMRAIRLMNCTTREHFCEKVVLLSKTPKSRWPFHFSRVSLSKSAASSALSRRASLFAVVYAPLAPIAVVTKCTIASYRASLSSAMV